MLRLLTVDSRRPMVAGDLPRLVSLLESVVETLSDNPWAADVRTVSNKVLFVLYVYNKVDLHA